MATRKNAGKSATAKKFSAAKKLLSSAVKPSGSGLGMAGIRKLNKQKVSRQGHSGAWRSEKYGT